MTKGYEKIDIEKIIPDGYWYREPENADWYVETVTISKGQAKMEQEKSNLFIAIDSATWHQGSKNIGIYSGWEDTHHLVKNFEQYINGIIAQRPIEALDQTIPQYIVKNTYDVIKLLARDSFEKFSGKTIGITGTAGKSTSKNLMQYLLENHYKVEATRGNHNTRTGVPLTIASAITNPDYLIVESAISGLWMNPHGIMRDYPPDVALITSIDGGQQKTALETAVLKAKIAEGMNHQGIVIINKESKEYLALYQHVKKYNDKLLTYGIDSDSDSYLIEYTELKGKALITASILGEQVRFTSKVIGKAMTSNIIGVLTVLKALHIPIQSLLPFLSDYQASEGVQYFEEIQMKDGTNFTILDDSWNATGIAMIEAIQVFDRQAKYYQGKKIAILGRIENLGKTEAIRQHKALATSLIDSNVDLVFAHGLEMKYLLAELPETLIGGYFENSQKLAQAVAPLIDEDAFVLVKGSPRSSDFKHVKKYLLNAKFASEQTRTYTHQHPYATGAGAMTFNLITDEVVGIAGDIQASQNQGLGNILLINQILEKIFANELQLTDQFKPGNQALKENKSIHALQLVRDKPLSLYTILLAAIVQNAPNALLMLANQVIGSNNRALTGIQQEGLASGINKKAIMNLTGRRITNVKQELTLPQLYIAGKLLFDKYPRELDLLAQNYVTHNEEIYRTNTNLFKNGMISHGLFYGYKDSIGLVLSQIDSKKYLTVVLGAVDAYERDNLVTEALNAIEPKDQNRTEITSIDKDHYTINLIGDTYFGEFYTEIRQKRKQADALQKYGRSYSFDKIRSMLTKGDYNICNFEAAITDQQIYKLKANKPFVLHADAVETVPALQAEGIDLVTLANNHLLDCGLAGLQLTLKQFKAAKIGVIGAGLNQAEAEKPLIKIVNGKRLAIFTAYWYRNPMYFAYDFYAAGNQPGVACLSGKIMRNIAEEKEKFPDGLVVVIPHWGVDFQTVSRRQREYAHSLIDAGADLIIGHGAHMIQEIEMIKGKPVVYSIGNGVFNSNGEYNRRHVAAYSFFVQLIHKERWKLKLYPLYCNNLKTFWQPNFVDKVQFDHCSLMLQSFGSTELKEAQDSANQYYYEIDL